MGRSLEVRRLNTYLGASNSFVELGLHLRKCNKALKIEEDTEARSGYLSNWGAGSKTGVPVYTVLPDSVVKALEATPRVTPKLYFRTGQGKPETAVKDWQAKLRHVFDLTGLEKGQGNSVAHRFRDTFSVELLLAGVPIERVSILLGHSSVRITERHYSPWVRSRQEQLEADVRRA